MKPSSLEGERMPTTDAQSDLLDPTCQHLQVLGDQSSVLPVLAQQIRALIDLTRNSIIEIGVKLIVAKRQLEHGAWLPWLASEFGWNARTAQRYIRVAVTFSTKCDTVSYSGLAIDASALYALASLKVPEDVRDKAIETAKAGTRVTQRVALRLIETAKPVAEPAPAEDTHADAVDTTEDADTDAIDRIERDTEDDDVVFPDRPPIPPAHSPRPIDFYWQDTLRYWIDQRRDGPILLSDVIDRFVETIPPHDALERWCFDFEDALSHSANEMRKYALLVSLRSLNVTFSPPLGRGLYPASETEFIVPRRRCRWS
jgi:hypothetical protein